MGFHRLGTTDRTFISHHTITSTVLSHEFRPPIQCTFNCQELVNELITGLCKWSIADKTFKSPPAAMISVIQFTHSTTNDDVQ